MGFSQGILGGSILSGGFEIHLVWTFTYGSSILGGVILCGDNIIPFYLIWRPGATPNFDPVLPSGMPLGNCVARDEIEGCNRYRGIYHAISNYVSDLTGHQRSTTTGQIILTVLQLRILENCL